MLRHYRIREVERVFKAAHIEELRNTPIQNYPMVKARHAAEIDNVRAGKLDIIDRKSWAWPYLPASVQRLSMPVAKSTPYNLRRFSRTPVARRAINLIKNSIIQQPWEIRPLDGVNVDDEDEQQERIKIATSVFRHPNNSDSHQTWIEMGIEDMCVLGAFVSEIQLTLDPKRPLKMWIVNVESIRIFVSWSESTPDLPHYAQMTGLQGERGAILFYDDELMYARDNPASDNPFGLGRLEVAFTVLNDLLGVQRMAGMAGSDQVHKTWLWWEQPQSDAAYQIVRRHIQNEMEGQAKVSIIGGMKKPEVVEITPVSEADLLLNWQEMLIRMIANAFDMSAMTLGIEHDVNRAVGEVLQDSDFRSAVVPMAKRLQEAFTRKILHEKLGWYDLEFAYLKLDDPDLETQTDMCARMYSGNALTPNEWRSRVGMQPLETPFGDLTQFEAMMLNAEVASNLQNRNAALALERQLDLQQALMPPAPPANDGATGPQGESGGQVGKPSPNSPPPPQGGSKGQQTQSGGPQIAPPKPITTPKFPISGSRWTARQIAQMPVNQLADRINGGQLPRSAKKLLRDMKAQEPGILDQMTQEVQQFFEDRIAQEEERVSNIDQSVVDEWTSDLKKRVRKQNKRLTDMTSYLHQTKDYIGQPGKAPRPYRSIVDPGKPGKPPAPRGI